MISGSPAVWLTEEKDNPFIGHRHRPTSRPKTKTFESETTREITGALADARRSWAALVAESASAGALPPREVIESLARTLGITTPEGTFRVHREAFADAQRHEQAAASGKAQKKAWFQLHGSEADLIAEARQIEQRLVEIKVALKSLEGIYLMASSDGQAATLRRKYPLAFSEIEHESEPSRR